MAKITKDEVVHLATLSNVTLDEQEIESLQQDLESILGYITQLSELNTDGVEPTYQVGGLTSVWRDDQVNETPLARESLLDLSPSQHDHQIKVPKVL
jgi:aspartyl-tRNA(Asn)/glutamyl-tRNA(Gln) amidotransferase subunit C